MLGMFALVRAEGQAQTPSCVHDLEGMKYSAGRQEWWKGKQFEKLCNPDIHEYHCRLAITILLQSLVTCPIARGTKKWLQPLSPPRISSCDDEMPRRWRPRQEAAGPSRWASEGRWSRCERSAAWRQCGLSGQMLRNVGEGAPLKFEAIVIRDIFPVVLPNVSGTNKAGSRMLFAHG